MAAAADVKHVDADYSSDGACGRLRPHPHETAQLAAPHEGGTAFDSRRRVAWGRVTAGGSTTASRRMRLCVRRRRRRQR